MQSAGYTLVELLVVISILSILAAVGFVNFNRFSSNQVTTKAAGQIQTFLRLAQSNATTSTICNTQGSTSWSIKFVNATTIELRCNPSDYRHKTYVLENAQMEIICGAAPLTFPATFTYSTGIGKLSTTPVCSSLFVFTISNSLNSSAAQKQFKVSNGGAIDVE